MNTAVYTEAVTANGGVGKYPLSTETLDFIQEQVKLLELLAGCGGVNYILRAPDGTNEGLAVIENNQHEPEVVTINPKPTFSSSVKYLTITTKKENIKADDETYLEARIYRTAQFTTTKGDESVDINNFANVKNKQLEKFPTNQMLSTKIDNMPQTVLNYLKDVFDEKLTSKTITGITSGQLDALKTPCVLSCTQSVALFGRVTDYTLIVMSQGIKQVRQEVIQNGDCHYVRTFDGTKWGEWGQKTETAMHIDVKVVGSTVYLRHGVLSDDCSIVLLRKKKRSAYRSTGGPNSYSKNKGVRKKRQPKNQYVHFKGIILGKGTPGKWYVPKCVGFAGDSGDRNLIGKELPTLCSSLFYVGHGGYYRIQGLHRKIILRSTPSEKNTYHRGYARIGIQIARLNEYGGKDSGGEIVKMKYRISQRNFIRETGRNSYSWLRSFSVD